MPEVREDQMLPPQHALEVLDAHDSRMDSIRESLKLRKGMYTSRFWEAYRSTGQQTNSSKDGPAQIEVETNRLAGAVESYVNAIYPKSARVVVGPGTGGAGNAKHASLVCNKWLNDQQVHRRVVKTIRQAILYPGGGIKVGVSDDKKDPIDRVWFRVIPWWEIVTDWDVYDEADARFIGHAYYRPRQEVEAQYGLGTLAGVARDDFIGLTVNGTNTPKSRAGQSRTGSTSSTPASDQDAFVRIFEIVNFVDPYTDAKGKTYKGRFEVYVLGQGDMKEPVYVGPVPFADHAGEPKAHIIPLIFNHEPEYPLRGIALSDRVYEQNKEINIFRSYRANAARRDARIYLLREGLLDAEQKTMLSSGHDGLILEVDDSNHQGQDFDKLFKAVQHGTISPNITDYETKAERDLERALGTSPNAYGVVTKATATEIMNLRDYSESEFGRHALIKDGWISDLVRLFLRALIAALEMPGEADPGIEEGMLYDEHGPPDADGAEVEEESGEDEEPVEGEEEDEESIPGVPEDPEEDFDEDEDDYEPDEIVVFDGERNEIRITVDDLDGDFQIEVVNTRSTPFSDAASRQALVEIGPQIMQLWEQVQAGGPMGKLARVMMASMVEKFSLPHDAHPDALEAEMKEDPAEEPKPEPGPPPGPGGPPGQGGPPPPGQVPSPVVGPGPMTEDEKAQILTMPADAALDMMQQKAMVNGDAELAGLVDQLRGADPEAQAEMIQRLMRDG